MSAVLSDHPDVLPALSPVAQAIAGPGMTVIDASTGSITFEHKGASLLLAEAVAVYEEAKDLAPLIDSDAMYTEGGELLKKITDSYKTLDEARLATTKPLRDKVDEINGDYAPAIAKRKDAAQVLKTGLLAYDQKKERERLEAERVARQRAEEEQRRAQAEARAAEQRAIEEAARTRREAEEKAATERATAEQQAAAMRKQADELDATGNVARAAQLRSEASALLGEAENVAQTHLFDAEQQAAAVTGDAAATAEALRSSAEMMTPSAVSIARPRTAGVSTSTKYSAEVTDPKAFLQFVVSNYETMQHLVSIEAGKLNTMAQNQKDRFSIPGCVLHKNAAMSARRR